MQRGECGVDDGGVSFAWFRAKWNLFRRGSRATSSPPPHQYYSTVPLENVQPWTLHSPSEETLQTLERFVVSSIEIGAVVECEVQYSRRYQQMGTCTVREMSRGIQVQHIEFRPSTVLHATLPDQDEVAEESV